MIHSSAYQPRAYPINGDTDPAEIDRVQDITPSLDLDREKINEVGRDGTVGFRTGIPTLSLTLRQLEYGNIEFWNIISNNITANVDVVHGDFDDAMWNLAAYKTDNDAAATFLGTGWYPKLRTSGFSLNIGDPDALCERNFTFVGEDEIFWTDNNKYVVYFKDATASGAGHTITIGSGALANYPVAVADPEESGSKYFILAFRLRAGVTTELTEVTDFTYNSSTQVITIAGSLSGDTYKFWYTATTYITGDSIFTDNDTDVDGIQADSVTILLQTSNTLTKIQSIGVDVTFDRQDVKEIGNTEVVARGIRDRTVRITLGRLLTDHTLERLLGGHAASYGKYNPRNYLETLSIIVKFYTNSAKTTFKMGYKFVGLSPVSQDGTVPTKDFIGRGTVLEGEEVFITSTEANL